MLQVDIKKKLGGFTLDVHFKTGEGMTALLGASGCGKSMTLKCIAGVERPDSGRIVLNGRVLFDSERGVDLPPQRRRVGMLFQEYALFPHMTALQNVEAALGGRRSPQRRERAMERLCAVQLEDHAALRPAQLSGGQRQRLALARMLAAEPEALLLDEPFSALDGYLQWQLELELARTLSRYGGDVVLVSHDRGEVCRLCSRVCVLTDGRSEPEQSVAGLMSDPGTVSAALLSGCKNLSPIRRLDENTVYAQAWGVTLRLAGPVPPNAAAVGVRAHHIVPGKGENEIPCRVERVIDDAFSTIVMLSAPEGTTPLRMELEKGAWTALGAPETLTVSLPAGRLMALKEGNS